MATIGIGSVDQLLAELAERGVGVTATPPGSGASDWCGYPILTATSSRSPMTRADNPRAKGTVPQVGRSRVQSMPDADAFRSVAAANPTGYPS